MTKISIPKSIPIGENPLIISKNKTLTSGGKVKDIHTQLGNIVMHNITVKFPVEKSSNNGVRRFFNTIIRKLNGPSLEEIHKVNEESILAIIKKFKAAKEGDSASFNHYNKTSLITENEKNRIIQQRQQSPIGRIKRFLEQSGIMRFNSI